MLIATSRLRTRMTAGAASGVPHREASTRAASALFDELEVTLAARAGRLVARLGRDGRDRRRRVSAAREHVFGDILGPHGAALLALDHGGVDRGPRQDAAERLAGERERAGDRFFIHREVDDRGGEVVAEAQHERWVGAEAR